MDALNHADQMRLANLINDNSDDADIQKKIDQVVELTTSTRDQAAVALHDCHYNVHEAVEMILEGGQATVENQWRSAGKKKNKNISSQAAKSGTQAGAHTPSHASGSNKNTNATGKTNQAHSASSNSGPTTVSNSASGSNQSQNYQQSQHHHHTSRGTNQANATVQSASNQFNNHTKQEALDSLKNFVGISSSNLISSSDLTTTSTTAPTKTPSLQQQQQQQQLQRGAAMQGGNRQHQQRSTRIPDSAVEMPNNELQVSSLNVQFGELDLRDGSVGATDTRGTFQDVLETNRLGRQSGLPNSHSSIPAQDGKSNRQLPQQHLGKGIARRPYNNSNNNDDRRFYNNPNRGGRQASNNQRAYNQRPGPINNNNSSRGVRTILNRGLQPNSTLSSGSTNQPTSGFPNSIDTWTNSTAEAATKPANTDAAIGVGSTLRVGQWSDVAGTEDWSEEDWDAKVMETKVFTPSTKAVDGPVASQKSQPLLTDTSLPPQMNLASKLSETVRDDVSSQQSTLNTVAQQAQAQQSSQKPISHMNDIFDASVAKAVLEQQNLAALKPKTSIGMSHYNKDTSDAKVILDQQNLSSIKPKTTMSMNQYNKEASESLKTLVGISSAKAGVPSVPPGALPLMSQPQYIMGNAYQPAIFPYAYQTPDVHYQVAAPTAGRDQSFQSVYSPSDANKFNRGTDGDAPSITTTQSAPVASQTHNQAFVANALHAGYQLTYAVPGAFNMMPQNLYGAAPIFPHMPQPTNTGSANTVYQKNTASYQHHTGYSGYDQLNPLIQDYVKQQNYSGSGMQQQQPTSKSSGVSSELDMATGGNSYNMYGSVNKNQPQASKQASYNDTKGYQQQMSGNGQQFGFSHNAQQPASIAGYPLLQAHNLDGSNLNPQSSAQQQLQQHSSAQRGGAQVNPSKYYPSWN